MSDPLLTNQQVADELGLALSTVYNYSAWGWMPEPDDLVHNIKRWKRSTIHRWAKKEQRGIYRENS